MGAAGLKHALCWCVSSLLLLLLTVVHTLAHVVNIYIFSISDLSILSCLFPKVFLNNGYFSETTHLLPTSVHLLEPFTLFVCSIQV